MLKVLALIFILSPVAFAEDAFVDSPDQCLSLDKFPCSVRSVRGPLALEKGENSFVLDKNSSLRFGSSSEAQLLSGKVWIEKAKGLKFKVSPKLSVLVSGEFFASRVADRVWLRNLNGETEFVSDLVFKSEALPVGFENWFGRISTNGSIERGVMKPIELKQFLTEWLPLAQNSVAELKQKVGQYREFWKKNAELSAQFYQEIVERRMASVREKELSQAQQVEKAKKAIQKIRELYRQKNYLDPSDEAP